MPANFSQRNRGFSLIEVLVAVVIMSIGLLALASLQLHVIRSSAEAKTAAAAASIAKDIIETRRSFTVVDPGYRTITDIGWTTVTDAGGLGGVSFEFQQTVSRFVFDKGLATPAFKSVADTLTDAAITAACPNCLIGKDFKRIQVDVRWSDANGVQRIVSMEDVIDSLEPTDSAKVVRTNTGSAPRSVKVVIVNPGSVGGVIPIAIGDGTSTAASNPTPQIRGNSSVVSETRFDVFTYSAINGGTAQAESRVETTVMHCTCSTTEAPSDVNARGFRPTYWNGFRYAPPALTSYQPPAGWLGSGSESELCSACCRDHNDPVNVSGPKFDPWRTGLHSHYRVTAPNVMTIAPTGTYDEACRLIRVDGIWRVAADLRDDYFAFLETNNTGSLTDVDQNARPYSPTTAAKDRYEDFVLDYLDDRISNNSVATTYNTPSAPTYPLDSGSYETTYQLNNPTSAIQLPSTAEFEDSNSKWLHSRGLYIDWLEPDAITKITEARTNCPDSSTQALRSVCVLPFVPFTSINLTELSNWVVGTSNPQSIVNFQVQNGFPVDASNLNKPKRGNVFRGTTPANNATDSIYSHASESNAAVALFAFYTIDQDEQNNFASVTPSKGHDSQPFQIQGGSPPSGTPFTINISGQANTTPYPNIIRHTSPNTPCNPGTPNPYVCGISALGNGNMELRVTDYTKTSSLSVPNGCKNSGSTSMPIILDYDVSAAVNVTQLNLPALTIVPSNDGSVTDQSVVTFGPVANNDVLAITFSGPERWCPSNYAQQANNDSTGLNCSGPGNNTPTWSTTFNVCPVGTP